VSNKSKHVAWLCIKGAFVAALLWWLVERQALSWQYFTFSLGSIPWIALGALLIFASILMTGTRYWLLLTANGILLPLPLILRTELAATFFNLCSIGPVGGDIVRTYYVYKFGGKPMTVTGSTVVDRMIGLYALLVIACLAIVLCEVNGGDSAILPSVRLVIFGAVGGIISLGLMGAIRLFMNTPCTIGAGAIAAGACMVMAKARTGHYDPLWLIGACCIVASTVVVGALGNGRLEKFLEWFKGLGEIPRHGAILIEAFFVLKNDTGCILKALTLSLVQQSSFVLAMLAFAHALPLPLAPTFNDIVFATPLTFVLAVLPLPGAGLGINEAAFDYLLTMTSPDLVGGASLYLFYRAWLLIVSTTGIPFYLSNMKKL
jgi:uncharacterized membrane protein YbhN (UPF0104 family)